MAGPSVPNVFAGLTADGVAALDANFTAILQQMLTNTPWYAGTVGGTSDALTATINPSAGLSALTDGMTVSVETLAANLTTTPTFDLTLGAQDTTAIVIVKGDDAALVIGDIPAFGRILLQYSARFTAWVLMSVVTSTARIKQSQILFSGVVDMTLTTDQVLTAAPNLPPKYQITEVDFYSPTNTNLAAGLAAGGLYTAISKGGFAIVPAVEGYTALSASTGAGSLMIADLAPSALGRTYTAALLYVSLTTGNGSAVSASVIVKGIPLP